MCLAKSNDTSGAATFRADADAPSPCCRRLHFESESFKGCVVVWVQGLPNSPPDLFANRNRKSSITVQGVFRRPSGLDDICTGQEFSRAPTNLPPKWLVESVLIKVESVPRPLPAPTQCHPPPKPLAQTYDVPTPPLLARADCPRGWSQWLMESDFMKIPSSCYITLTPLPPPPNN